MWVARVARDAPMPWRRPQLLPVLMLLQLATCTAQEPGPDTNGDGVVDEHEARAQQELNDSLADAAALLSSGSARSKENAAEGIARMAIATTISQPFHPVTYRNAAVKAGIVERLIALLADPAMSLPAQRHALVALEAIATDDPSTDLDNNHARYVCDAGAVQHVVRLLSSRDEFVQARERPLRLHGTQHRFAGPHTASASGAREVEGEHCRTAKRSHSRRGGGTLGRCGRAETAPPRAPCA